ncbi:SurA N-terminal domain-containing protein [Streptomyces sp. MST-110588]|uniref:SurA N-terminal domain-containing protein n=1 Tax=Streptomyces sp. MST-110588 TaxID=2833628 RepID=UPI001F5D54EF|nr:SurA N-terminal domain-containing protein [Streptomyces sp. MST-110588]UNO41602.1 SurA N-terminal domain-containing protein [Streptomyces sp. MST-110588]
MFRRRTALSVTAAALLAASPLLTGCGTDAHPGAAAVVDGQRITVGQLQARVKDVRDAQDKAPQGAQLVENSGRLGLSTLNSMIFERILERGAKDAGVKVTERDVQQWRTAAEQRAGGADRLKAMWLQQAVPPGRIDAVVRNQLLLDGLAQRIGADRSQPQGQQQLGESLAKTSRDMGIDVNPRYGKWDDRQVILAETKDPWISKASTDRQQT